MPSFVTKEWLCLLLFFFIALPSASLHASDITVFGGLQHQSELTRSIGEFPPCLNRTLAQIQAGIRCATSPAGAFEIRTFAASNFGAFGIRFAHGGPTFGLEHTFAHSPNMFIYNSDLLVQTRRTRIQPYATAGIGGVFTPKDDTLKPNGSGGTSGYVLVGPNDPLPQLHSRGFGNKFALNYGGGIKLFTTPQLGVRFDMRGYTVPNIKDPRQDQTLNIVEVSLGLVFSF
jgi:hypothetical protein